MDKQQQYKAISKKIIDEVGGKDNIQGVAHCATRLRIVLKDDSLADLTEIENTDLVKGVFVAGDQLQIIFGSGLVNDIYRVFSEEAGNKDMSLNEVKDVSARKQNPFQQAIKA
uniref:glucose PTS transporter subunit EIIB n=1 Tax=Enterococcus faecium TaxID=1352 RepID=UPI00292ED38F